jgi:acyl carrier protein
MTAEQTLHHYIVTELDWQDTTAELTSDTYLLDGSAIDSMSVLALVTFIEEQFDIEILDEELIPESFGTIRAIGRLIESKERVGSGR